MSNDEDFDYMKSILEQINQQLRDNTDFMTSISERLKSQRDEHDALREQFLKEKLLNIYNTFLESQNSEVLSVIIDKKNKKERTLLRQTLIKQFRANTL